jgi:hypothetical protein
MLKYSLSSKNKKYSEKKHFIRSNTMIKALRKLGIEGKYLNNIKPALYLTMKN